MVPEAVESRDSEDNADKDPVTDAVIEPDALCVETAEAEERMLTVMMPVEDSVGKAVSIGECDRIDEEDNEEEAVAETADDSETSRDPDDVTHTVGGDVGDSLPDAERLGDADAEAPVDALLDTFGEDDPKADVVADTLLSGERESDPDDDLVKVTRLDAEAVDDMEVEAEAEAYNENVVLTEVVALKIVDREEEAVTTDVRDSDRHADDVAERLSERDELGDSVGSNDDVADTDELVEIETLRRGVFETALVADNNALKDTVVELVICALNVASVDCDADIVLTSEDVPVRECDGDRVVPKEAETSAVSVFRADIETTGDKDTRVEALSTGDFVAKAD